MLTVKEYNTVKAELSALAQELKYETYNDEAVFERYMTEPVFNKTQNMGIRP